MRGLSLQLKGELFNIWEKNLFQNSVMLVGRRKRHRKGQIMEKK